MEDPQIISISDLLRRRRPLAGAASLRNPSPISAATSTSLNPPPKKRKLKPSHENPSPNPSNRAEHSEAKPNAYRVLESLSLPTCIIGRVHLPDSDYHKPPCRSNDCLTFSDGASVVCCGVLGFDFRVLSRRIRVLRWNFVPLKCGGGVLEIVEWEAVEAVGEIGFDASPLLSLPSSDRWGERASICGKLVSVSPVVTVPCTLHSRKHGSSIDHGVSNEGNLKGFLAEIMACRCRVCDGGALRAEGGKDHAFTKRTIVYFCGPASSWRPVISGLLGYVVSIGGVKRKLVSTGRKTPYEMLVTTERAALYLTKSPSGAPSVGGTKISGKGELGQYKGTVTGIYMQGMAVELDEKVWLLLTDQLLVPPHSMRIGAIVSLSNIHFVSLGLSWGKMLILGSCSKTSISIESFSPLETQAIYASRKQSLLGKFIESLIFSAKLWMLLSISCFRKKFAGRFSEKDILGSKHNKGFVQLYAKSFLCPHAFWIKHDVFTEFYEQYCCNHGADPNIGSLKLAVPLSNFIDSCNILWINLLSQMPNETEASESVTRDSPLACEGKSQGQLIRRFISSEDVGLTLIGTLQICPSSERLQMIDATGGIDVVVPDLLSTSDLKKIYKVNEYVLVLEGDPTHLDATGTLEKGIFSCRSIFSHVKRRAGSDMPALYVHFFFKNATLLNLLSTHISENQRDDIKGIVGDESQLVLLTHKFPSDKKCQGNPFIAERSRFYAEATILPYCLFLSGKNGQNEPTERIGDNRQTRAGFSCDNSKTEKSSRIANGSNKNWELIPCKKITSNGHSPLQVCCSLATRSACESEKLVSCILFRANESKIRENKVLLEFNSATSSQYELLRIGVCYVIKYPTEDVCKHKALVTPTHIWSLVVSSDKVLHQTNSSSRHSIGASSMKDTGDLLDVHCNLVLSEASNPDFHLYIPSNVADSLGDDKDCSEGVMLRLFSQVGEISSVSSCIGTMLATPIQVPIVSNLNYRLPEGKLISVHGNIVEIHCALSPSIICIHVCDEHHMVKIRGTFGSHIYPIGMGPGANATFHRVLLTGQGHELMLVSVSFIVINFIREVSPPRRKCYSLSISSSDFSSKGVASMMSTCFILHLPQFLENRLLRFCCRVLTVHFLVLEKLKFQGTDPLVQPAKTPAVDILLAGFVVDDGSSLCCCWADGKRAARLLRLNETASKVFNNCWWSLKWRDSNKTLRATGYHLEKTLNKHNRITMRKCGALLESTSLDYIFSVDSQKEFSCLDENLLKFIILNACCGTMLSVVGTKIDSNGIERLKGYMEIDTSMLSMQNIWAREVYHIDPAQEARNILQELASV